MFYLSTKNVFQFDYDFQSYETLKSRENIFQKINGA
jgi:hypothetical protein